MPLGRALATRCLPLMFLRTIFTRSGRGISARHYEVELVVLVLAASVHRLHVGQADAFSHGFGHVYLLARAVDETPLRVREQDGQGYARKATTRTEIQHLRAGPKVQKLGDGQRVQHMVLVEIVNVFARDDVDLAVPVAVETVECLQLLQLVGAEVGEILLDKLHAVVIVNDNGKITKKTTRNGHSIGKNGAGRPRK